MKKLMYSVLMTIFVLACEVDRVGKKRLKPLVVSDFVGTWVSERDSAEYAIISMNDDLLSLRINAKNEATGIYRRFDFTADYQPNLGTEYRRSIRTVETLNGNPAEPRVSFELVRLSNEDVLRSSIMNGRLLRE